MWPSRNIEWSHGYNPRFDAATSLFLRKLAKSFRAIGMASLGRGGQLEA